MLVLKCSYVLGVILVLSLSLHYWYSARKSKTQLSDYLLMNLMMASE